eukprot:GFUD01042122.1.p1 GENE.GFUD01042122.1~~GFUD01042122.1.p1  ORF type:complete len:839 (+),score=179.04 GFUD01042122.1:572-3088(+)
MVPSPMGGKQTSSLDFSPGSGVNTPMGTSASQEEREYLEKVKQLEKYIEPLRRRIHNVDGLTIPEPKMKTLLGILSNPDKQMSIATMQRCENVLKRMGLDTVEKEGGNIKNQKIPTKDSHNKSHVAGTEDFSTIPGAQSPTCLLCDTILPDQTAVSAHYLASHPADTFRCVACTGSISLFPTYQDIYQHSVKVHQVNLEQAIQSAILLPSKLAMFQCKLCLGGREKLFLSEESVKRHLELHSVFFAKKWKKNSTLVCRICEASLGELPLENHLTEKHPQELFADENDIIEDIGTSGVNNVGANEDKGILETKPLISSNKNPSGTNSSRFLDQAKVKDSFKPDQLVSALFPKTNERKDKNKSLNLMKRDLDNNNLLETVGVTVKKEVMDNDVYVTSPITQNREPQSKKLKRLVSPESSSPSSFKDDQTGGEPSTNSMDSITAKFKFASAVIPLPCFRFPSHSPTFQPMLYSCTVCPEFSTILSFPSWVGHRESEDHRDAYMKAFFLNNCDHFTDAFFNPLSATLKSLTCFKCNTDFLNKSDLNLHHRREHLKNYSFPITEPYCYTCKMPLLTYPDAPPHTHSSLLRKTHSCTMCDMRVYSDGIYFHNLEAHSDQMFQCKLGLCKFARDGDKRYHFGYALHLYPDKLLQHQEQTHHCVANRRLTSYSCFFPGSLVKISCKKCPYHFLGEDRNHMIKHLKFEHNLDLRDLMTFSCRICGFVGYSIPHVIEHARKHRNNWGTPSSSRDNQGSKCSDKDMWLKKKDFPQKRNKSVKTFHYRNYRRSSSSSDSSDEAEMPVRQGWYKSKRYYRHRSRSSTYSSRGKHPARSKSPTRYKREKSSH